MAGRFKKNPVGNRVRLNLTIDPEVLEEAKELIHSTGQSISDFVTEALRAHVAKAKARNERARSR